MSRALMLTAVLVVALSITACGGSGAGSGAEEAADFSATTVEGDEFRLADKRGEVVALYFMAGY